MTSIYGRIKEAAAFLRTRADVAPSWGIVLGTGLGRVAAEIEVAAAVPYGDIPGFVTATVEHHEGRFIIGTLEGVSVVAMQGRFHYYEGYTMQEITFPIRVMSELGAKHLVISNAGGGMNPCFAKGDLVLIRDHINLLGGNPLIGVAEPELGPRFTDMGRPYSRRLMDIAHRVATARGIPLQEGVYVAVAGPSLETPAEYRFLRIIGADMVGMSTVPETIVAVQMGMEVLGVTIVSDLCDPDNLAPVNINDIVAACMRAESNLSGLIHGVVAEDLS